MDLGFNIYFKDKKIGRIEIKNNKLVKNEAYCEELFLRPYAKVTDAYTMITLLQKRIMCRERWDEEMLKSIGLKEYNFYEIIKRTHGLDCDDYFWFEFDGQSLNYEDIKVRE